MFMRRRRWKKESKKPSNITIENCVSIFPRDVKTCQEGTSNNLREKKNLFNSCINKIHFYKPSYPYKFKKPLSRRSGGVVFLETLEFNLSLIQTTGKLKTLIKSRPRYKTETSQGFSYLLVYTALKSPPCYRRLSRQLLLSRVSRFPNPHHSPEGKKHE